MKRAFFGLLALGSGLATLHFGVKFLRVGDTQGCYGNSQCLHEMQMGAEPRLRTITIALFALTAFCVWQAASHDH